MKTLAGVIIGLVLGIAASANAAHDSFVHVLEARFSGMAHLQITPGVRIPFADCGNGIGCTIRYDGVAVHGRHYDIGLDKLD